MSSLSTLMTWGPGTIVTIAFLTVAIVLLASAMRGRGAANAAKHWNAGSATIVSATLQSRRRNRGGVSYYPYVVYEYDVNGQRYRNDTLHFGNTVGTGVAGWAQNAIAKYQPGTQHPVYINPGDPRQAVLERNAPASNLLIWVAIVILVMLFISRAFTFGLDQYLAGIFSFMR